MGMGQGLPKAVESIVVKREGCKQFHVGFAEMNGWRPSMEDSHVIFMEDAWGFFGVFDGHGGSQCSSFIAGRLNEELRKGPPEDDAATKKLMLALDEEFLEKGQPSGSTGTFVLVREEVHEGKPGYLLRVGNIGDSRILLGRADGTMVEGPGTDGGLTTDHKPDHPEERARILRTGGTVEDVMGVARVNGDLAVSRAFGDAQYKLTGGPSQEDHPVSACPELTRCHCSAADFIVLVCDGISESNFSNQEVVSLAADVLGSSERPDAGEAAVAVCRRALERGSMDNLSCMIVLLNGAAVQNPGIVLLPGPVSNETLVHETWRKAYASMAEHAGFSLAEALEMRYDKILKDRDVLGSTDPPQFKGELGVFGSEPASLASGSPERIRWFSEWLQAQPPESEREEPPSRLVSVASDEMARPLIEQHPALKWDERLLQVCGQRGFCVQEDDSDHTAKVIFPEQHFSAWLPMSVIADPTMRVAPLEELREAVDIHPNLSWKEHLEGTCGKLARLCKVDPSDSTSQIEMLDSHITVWVPSHCLTDMTWSADLEDPSGEETDSTRAETPPRKRPRRSTANSTQKERKCPEAAEGASLEVDYSLMAH